MPRKVFGKSKLQMRRMQSRNFVWYSFICQIFFIVWICFELFLETGALREPILCDYSGNYYCHECHWGSLSVIPARVALNWDFEPRAVSRGVKQYLKLMLKKSIINLEEINPRLFSFVEELAFIKVNSIDIMYFIFKHNQTLLFTRD
jgi:hypothetical protein